MVKQTRKNDSAGPYYMLIACLLIYLFIFNFFIKRNKMRGSEEGPERGLKGAPEETNTK